MGGLFLLPVPLPMGEKTRGQLNGSGVIAVFIVRWFIAQYKMNEGL